MKFVGWRVTACLVCLLLIGCVSRAGLEGFVSYKKAFDEANAVSQAIFDELSISERRLAQSILQRRLGASSIETFDPDLAAYYATQGDPPFTGAYKRTFAIINEYNTVMVAMAGGEGFSEVKQKTLNLVGEIKKATAFFEKATPGTAVAGTGMDAATNALLGPILDLALAARSREVFRESFLETFPLVDELINRMRAGSEQVYLVLTYPSREEFRAKFDKKSIDEINARRAVYRAAVSNWVLLLDRSAEGLRAVKTEIEQPRTLTGYLGDVTSAAQEINLAAAELRKQLAALRATRAGTPAQPGDKP